MIWKIQKGNQHLEITLKSPITSSKQRYQEETPIPLVRNKANTTLRIMLSTLMQVQ